MRDGLCGRHRHRRGRGVGEVADAGGLAGDRDRASEQGDDNSAGGGGEACGSAVHEWSVPRLDPIHISAPTTTAENWHEGFILHKT